MADFFHGIKTRQLPTSLTPPARIETSVPLVFGCAPIHRLPAEEQTRGKVGEIVLLNTLSEAAQFLGIDVTNDDFSKWGLSEVAYCKFVAFGSAPILAVNLFDPDIHKKSSKDERLNFVDGKAALENPDVIGQVTIQDFTEETDFTVNPVTGVITVIEDSALETAIAAQTTITASYFCAAPEMVTSNDVIGGVDLAGKVTGLELTEQAFAQYRLIPNILIAPNFSQDPTIAALLAVKTQNINSIFNAGIAIADLPTEGPDAIKLYSGVPEYKNRNNLVSENLYLCYGKVKFGDDIINMSTQAACLCAAVDARNGFPHESISNENLQMQAMIVNGKEVNLTLAQANSLNGQGVATALNFIGGWVLWGNRTACYPGDLDVKNTFVSSRRMLAWHGNRFILSYWAKVDKPMNRVWFESIINSENIYLDGVVAAGALLGGRIEFNQDENPITDLMDGKVVFHTFLGLTTPGENIENLIEVDPSYLAVLFG